MRITRHRVWLLDLVLLGFAVFVLLPLHELWYACDAVVIGPEELYEPCPGPLGSFGPLNEAVQRLGLAFLIFAVVVYRWLRRRASSKRPAKIYRS